MMNDDKLNSIFVFTGSMIFMTGLRAGRIYFTKSSFVASVEIYKKNLETKNLRNRGIFANILQDKISNSNNNC